MPHRLTYSVKTINWSKLEQELQLPIITENCDLEEQVQELTKSLQAAIKRSTPPWKNRRRTEIGYWNNRLSTLRTRFRRLRKVYQNTLDANLRQIRLQVYRDAKEEFKEELYRTKIHSWEQFVNNNLSTNPWGIPYKMVMEKITSPMVMPTLQKRDGSKTTGWKESMELLINELLPEDTQDNDQEEHVERRNELLRTYANGNVSEPFSEEEVRLAIQSLRKKKNHLVQME